jgi:excisionase family DNA binding protein
MKEDELISPKEAAKMLGVSVMAIRSWENEKKIKCVKTLGGHRRFRLGDIQDLLKKNSG